MEKQFYSVYNNNVFAFYFLLFDLFFLPNISYAQHHYSLRIKQRSSQNIQIRC